MISKKIDPAVPAVNSCRPGYNIEVGGGVQK